MPKIVDNTLDLGDVLLPILIFGGVYSNLQAAQAIKEVAESHNIPAERCICTGDIVAYCGQPEETASLIREWGVHCLLGNCEESFASNSDDCGCGFDNGSQCDLLSNQWFSFSNTKLSHSNRQWFSTLPHHISFSMNNLSALVVHGSVSSINQFIFPSSEEKIFSKEFSLTKADMVFGGHSGIPFSKITGKKMWHNPGAIGMPANDGTSYTWYSIISPKGSQVEVNNKRLTYPHQDTVKKMKGSSLHNGYADCLLSGLWPSTDVLPEKEKKNTGKKLREHSHTIEGM
ncbi:MAG: putative phosphodiesterase [Candidatus Endobugula sp.]|jgi:predicted phosphodiesterase